MAVEHDNHHVPYQLYGYVDIADLESDLLEFQELLVIRALHLDKCKYIQGAP